LNIRQDTAIVGFLSHDLSIKLTRNTIGSVYPRNRPDNHSELSDYLDYFHLFISVWWPYDNDRRFLASEDLKPPLGVVTVVTGNKTCQTRGIMCGNLQSIWRM